MSTRATRYAAHIRAARAWARMDRESFGNAINVSERQVTRLESGQASADADLRKMIANACGVPIAFMEDGFAPLTEPISDLERYVRELASRLEEQQDEIDELRLSLVGDAIDDATQADAADDHNVRALPGTGRRARRKEDGRG